MRYLQKYSIFAAAMPSTETLKIDLRELAKRGESKTFSLTDSFFQELDQDEITGGNIQVKLNVRETAGDIFEVSIVIEGEVVVLCDRCLDDLTLPVEVKDNIKIYAGNEDEIPEDDDIRILEGNGYKYDMSWDIYELTELSLPLQRVHEDNQCNPDMTDRLANMI